MTNGKRRGSNNKRSAATPGGVWNRGMRGGPANPIRIRTKRLDEIDSDKIALAYWLLAKQIVDDGTGEQISETEAQRVAAELEASRDTGVEAEKRRRDQQSGSTA